MPASERSVGVAVLAARPFGGQFQIALYRLEAVADPVVEAGEPDFTFEISAQAGIFLAKIEAAEQVHGVRASGRDSAVSCNVSVTWCHSRHWP